MKKHSVIALLLMIVLLLSGCGEKSSVVLGIYKGITYTPVSVEVTQEELDAKIEAICNETTMRVSDESRNGTPVKMGDALWIDYTGYMDGEAFEHGSSEGAGASLIIGSGQFIPGFEEALVGKTVGDTVMIDVTFPENYTNNPDMSGKAAQFEVEIHYVYDTIAAEYNDEFVDAYTNGEYTDAEAYKDVLIEELTETKANNAYMDELNQVLTTAIDSCQFTIDQKDVDTAYKKYVANYTNQAAAYNMSLEEFVGRSGATMEQFYAAASNYAENVVKTELFYDAVAKAEGIKLTKQDYEERIGTYLEKYGYSYDRKTFEQNFDISLIRQSMLYDMLNEKIMEWATPAE